MPVVIVNFALGTYLSHKIAGPLSKIKRAAGEIERGNLEVEVKLREGDLIQSYAVEFNNLLQTLRRLIYRDHDHAQEADKFLTETLQWLSSGKEPGDAGKNQAVKLINGAKSKLSVINKHFMKGRSHKEV